MKAIACPLCRKPEAIKILENNVEKIETVAPKSWAQNSTALFWYDYSHAKECSRLIYVEKKESLLSFHLKDGCFSNIPTGYFNFDFFKEVFLKADFILDVSASRICHPGTEKKIWNFTAFVNRKNWTPKSNLLEERAHHPDFAIERLGKRLLLGESFKTDDGIYQLRKIEKDFKIVEVFA